MDEPVAASTKDQEDRSHTEDDEQGLSQLNRIKTQAIQALTANLSKIDGVDPERKFEIYMTALRYAHDTGVLESALKSAQQIEDPSAQSEALIELVQEINYTIAEIEEST